jgi:pSer/pThr/pTyr-binding forkhead associated (FHA) protein
MRDGHTKRLDSVDTQEINKFLEHRRVKLVLVSGPAAGQEYLLGPIRLTLGRGPNVDIEIADETLSRQHAAVEYTGGRFRVEDLGSTNGLTVNGERVQAGELEHGDSFKIGNQQFQLLVEEQDTTPDTYVLPSEP